MHVRRLFIPMKMMNPICQRARNFQNNLPKLITCLAVCHSLMANAMVDNTAVHKTTCSNARTKNIDSCGSKFQQGEVSPSRCKSKIMHLPTPRGARRHPCHHYFEDIEFLIVEALNPNLSFRSPSCDESKVFKISLS